MEATDTAPPSSVVLRTTAHLRSGMMHESDDSFDVHVNDESGIARVRVTLPTGLLETDYAIPDPLGSDLAAELEQLEADTTIMVPKPLMEPHRHQISAITRVHESIKFHLNWDRVESSPVGMRSDLVIGERLIRVQNPFGGAGMQVLSAAIYKKSLASLQSYIDKDDHPFATAIDFLHHALNICQLTRHSWIAAAIAAELAVKEYLTRTHPSLEPVLTELQSPSMDKLLHKVIPSLGGPTLLHPGVKEEGELNRLHKRMIKSIVDGANKRNRLVHRTQEAIPSSMELFSYLENVQLLILMLKNTFYPEDEVMRQLYRHRSIACIAFH